MWLVSLWLLEDQAPEKTPRLSQEPFVAAEEFRFAAPKYVDKEWTANLLVVPLTIEVVGTLVRAQMAGDGLAVLRQFAEIGLVSAASIAAPQPDLDIAKKAIDGPC